MTIEAQWLTATVDYEGLPLALRVKPSIDEERTSVCPHLGSISQALKTTRPDGMPESTYNSQLADFDAFVHESLPNPGAEMMLVETFDGRRTYYACFHTKEGFEKWLARLQAAYPLHVLEGEFDRERAWSFYSAYRSDFGW